jgi:beta-lactam-binding protein with PASTA domain
VACEPPGPGQDPPCKAEDVGTVIQQDPPPGKKEQGSSVTLQIGRSASSVKIPDVKGKTKDEAARTLAEAGLVASQDEVTEDTTDAKLVGKVTNTNPGIGVEVAKGTTVKLVVGKQPAQVDVPNVVGQDFNSAKTNLENEGFKVTRTDVDSDQPTDIVTAQNPKKARPGSTITLQVSKGQQQDPNQIVMPNLVGQNEAAARQALRNLGWDGELKVEADDTNDPTKLNEVAEQDVQPGTKIAKNQTVNVRVFRTFRPGGTP